MQLNLQSPFSSDSPVNEEDVLAMKGILNFLGYYDPPKNAGITAIPDRPVFQALKNFQKDNDLPANGKVKPGDDTELALNRAVLEAADGPAAPSPGAVDKAPLPTQNPPTQYIPGTSIPDRSVPEGGWPGSSGFSPFPPDDGAIPLLPARPPAPNIDNGIWRVPNAPVTIRPEWDI